MVVSLTLPWPPSVNRMWRTPRSGKLAGRTLLSEEGRVYRHAVADQVMVQHAPRHTLKGRLCVRIGAYPPDRRARDLDNLLKGVLDAIQHAGVIESDSHIDDLHIVRGVVSPGGKLHVLVTELETETQMEAA